MSEGSSGDWPFEDAPASAARPVSGEGLSEGEVGAGSSGPFGLPPERRYAEGGLLGRGGMGEVRCAEDLRLGREVAVKRARRDHAALIREARLTARLEHPGIVPVYGAGRDEEGQPFYTMPVVRGRSLAQALAAAEGLAGRLRLLRHVLDACQAVAYAHSQGVLHRDLKPANIMVGEFGETLVVDWGLAASLEEAWGGVGTAEYAAPEQLRGARLDRRADVFALGGVLFELLSGQPPRATVDGPLRLLPPEAPAELNAIAGKALSIEPSARYADAGELAGELEAWFEGRRVQAHDYSTWELLLRLLRAWSLPLGIGALALVAVGVSVTVGYLRTAEERDRAREAEQEAVAARHQSERSLALALIAQAQESAARDERASAEVLAAGALALGESPEARGVLARFGGRARPERVFYAPLPDCERVGLSPDAEALFCVTSDALLTLRPGQGPHGRYPMHANYAAFVGDRLAVVGATGEVFLTEGAEGLRRIPGSEGNPRRPVGSVDGQVVITGSGETWLIAEWGESGPLIPEGTETAWAGPGGEVLMATQGGELVLWRGGQITHRVRRSVPHVMTLGLSEAGPLRAVVGGVSGELEVVDLVTGERVFEAQIGPDAVAHTALYGDQLAVSLTSGDVLVWSLERGARVARLPSTLAVVAWREDGEVLRVVGSAVEDWRLPEESWPHLHHFTSGLSSVHVSPDGDLLAAGLGSGDVSLRRLRDGVAVAELGWQQAVTKDVAFSPDGALLAAAVAGAHAGRVFHVPSGELAFELPGPGQRRVAWATPRRLVVAPYSQELHVWDLRGDEARLQVVPIGTRPGDLEASRDGVLLSDQRGRVARVEGEPPTLRPLLEDEASVSIAAAGDGLLVAHSEGVFWHRPGREPVWIPTPGPRTLEVAGSPDGRWMALGHLDGTVTLWSLGQRRLVAVLRGHGARVVSLHFSEDGRWLVTGSWDGDARVWALAPLTMPADALLSLTEGAWGRDVAGILEE
ncbi:MAG: protein kinase [Alphaproteobacteria bacterium]|nr:protein kinase [Alphaproteobacteria bacterium]